MSLGPGYLDAEGVWIYGEDDLETLQSDLLNLGTESVSVGFTLDRGRLGALEANLPQRVAAGTVAITGNANPTRTMPIVFPVGRFTVPPIVLPAASNSLGGATLTATALNITTIGCDIRLAAGAAFSATYVIPWLAIQMTSGAAAG